MNDRDFIIRRIDELEASVGRIEEVIDRLDDVEVRISDLENEDRNTVSKAFTTNHNEHFVQSIKANQDKG